MARGEAVGDGTGDAVRDRNAAGSCREISGAREVKTTEKKKRKSRDQKLDKNVAP